MAAIFVRWEAMDMDKYYKLLYWGYNADEPTTDVSRSADVTVPPETLMAMLGPAQASILQVHRRGRTGLVHSSQPG